MTPGLRAEGTSPKTRADWGAMCDRFLLGQAVVFDPIVVDTQVPIQALSTLFQDPRCHVEICPYGLFARKTGSQIRSVSQAELRDRLVTGARFELAISWL